MKEIPQYLIKLVNEFEEISTKFDCLIEKDSPFIEFKAANFQLREKALEIAFSLSCELEGYLQ